MTLKNKIHVSLDRDLRKKYGVRSFPVSKGDIVSIKVGGRKDEGGKVVNVDHRSGRVSVEGITIAKADGKQEEFFIEPDKLVITKLDFSRADRLENLKKIAALKNRTIEIEEPTPPEEAPEAEAEGEAEPEENEEEETEEEETSESESEEAEEEPAEEDDELEEDESEEMEMESDDNQD